MKYILPVTTIALAVGGLALWLFGQLLVPGMALMTVALLLSVFAPGVIGRLGTSHRARTKVDAEAVKKYRAENPKATIADGVRATQE